MGKLGWLISTGLGAAGGYVAARQLAARQARDGAGRPEGGASQRLVHIARIRAGNEADLRRLVEASIDEARRVQTEFFNRWLTGALAPAGV